MRIAVIGAGIVGVTTAYELALQGHAVTVLERRGSVASESSFAMGGVLTPGQVAPWAAPGLGRRLLASLAGGPATLRLSGLRALGELPWLWRAWRASRARMHVAQRQAMHELAEMSRRRMLELTQALHLDFEQAGGQLVLLRSERALTAAGPTLAWMRDAGVAHEVADATRCRVIEPGLNPDTPLHAGIHLPHDGVGNGRQFAHLLKSEAQRLGAVFRFGTPVLGLTPGASVQLELAGKASETFDAVVVCAGAQANRVLRGAGLRLPLVSMHGYSVTAPLRLPDGQAPPGPRAAVLDARSQITLARLGQRVRVAGGAELGGRPDRLTPGALRALYRALDDWFPGAVLARDAQHWKGARPMLPDGPPALGASGAAGVWLNLGHGASGWTLACGSARVLAECIAGRDAPLNMAPLSAARLRGG